MALQICGLNINHTNKELKPHGTEDFPCAGYESEYSDSPDSVIPWHWHEDFEIILITEGIMKLQVPGKTFLLNKGELAIINANITHYAEGAPQCSIQSLVFSPSLVAGHISSAVYKKYLSPLMESPDFVCLHIKEDAYTEHFVSAFLALKDDEDFYEFTVREQLSHIMIKVYSAYADRLTDRFSPYGADKSRIKDMLEFIHLNYPEDITLSDICRAGRIGEREALRCFKRTIGESPIQYLLKHRLMKSANMLLSDPNRGISEIAGLCGFNSLSYFSKKFRELYLCTPGMYRKQGIEK